MAKSVEDGRSEAAAYQTQPRERVLRAHPHLASAYAAEDRLREVARAAGPLSRAVENVIEQVIKQNVATAIRKGVEPQVLPQTERALQDQVAFRNLDHVVGARALDPKSPLDLPAAQRARLVEATSAAFDQQRNIGIDPLKTARLLGQADAPQTKNPYEIRELAEEYRVAREAHAAQMASREKGADKGLDRS